MFPDIVDLRNFYTQPLGHVARRLINRAVRGRWPDTRGMAVMGIGYATPYLGMFREEVERTFAFMPAAQGVVKWPSAAPSLAALVHETLLPLQDASIDRVIAVHALETTGHAPDMLREAWRVLAAGGRLLLVVPNRRGIWARFEHTPFGTGRPFSRGQLNELLREANFTPSAWADALFFPPSKRRFMMRFHNILERTGRRLWPIFSGVIVVEAQKRLYQGLPVAKRASRRVFVPVLSPQGAATRNLFAATGPKTLRAADSGGT
jgi:SAM-dependent methyltransferase